MNRSSSQPSRFRVRRALRIGSILGLAVLGACTSSSKSGSAGEPGAVEVEGVNVRSEVQSAELRIPSVLRPKSDVRVRAKSGGEVTRVEVEEGMRVATGQVLAALEDEEERLSLLESEAELELKQKEWDRAEELHNKEIIAEGSLEEARYGLKTAKARYERARLDLDHRTVVAPVSGIVMERWVHPGDTVEEGQELFRVVEPSVLQADLYIPEEERNWIHDDTSALLIASNRTEEVSVDRVVPLVDPSSATFKVKFLLENDTGRWFPGQSCTFVFSRVDPETVLSLPVGTFVERSESGDTYVYVIRGDAVERKPVRLGAAMEGRVQVLEGLVEGEEIVFQSQGRLADGTKVSIRTMP